MPFIEFFARVDAVDAAVVMETARNFIIDKAQFYILNLNLSFDLE